MLIQCTVQAFKTLGSQLGMFIRSTKYFLFNFGVFNWFCQPLSTSMRSFYIFRLVIMAGNTNSNKTVPNYFRNFAKGTCKLSNGCKFIHNQRQHNLSITNAYDQS